MALNVTRVLQLLIVGAVAAAPPPIVPLAMAEDFRVENRMFSGDREDTAAHSTTIFCQGVVYDYLQQPAEAILFERAASQFTVLDAARRVRTELTTAEVGAFTEKLQQWASRHRDPFMKFMAAPQFDDRSEKSSGKLELVSPWMTYRATLAPATGRELAEQYREFSDWYARLNSVLNPGSRPPFPRLWLNAALAGRGTIAQEVELTLKPASANAPKQPVLRTRHELIRPLTQVDFARIAETRRSIATSKPVGFEQYRKAGDR